MFLSKLNRHDANYLKNAKLAKNLNVKEIHSLRCKSVFKSFKKFCTLFPNYNPLFKIKNNWLKLFNSLNFCTILFSYED